MYINFTEIDNLGIQKIYGNPVSEVETVTFNSLRITDNAAFICIKGQRHDGHFFIKEALEQGASVIIGDKEEALESAANVWKNKTFILVSDTKIAMARLASQVYGACNEKLKLVSVTGTNGKTTVTGYVKSLLNQLGLRTGSIGTLGITSSKETIDFKKSTPTTPEAPDLHYLFRYLYTAGEEAVAVEVSSIAIAEKRVEDILFDVGVHTNLSSEHLEYHHNFEAYKQAKLKLFEQVKTAVVNLDDEGMSEELIKNFNGPLITYSLNTDSNADIKADQIQSGKSGSEIRLSLKGTVYHVFVPIIADYNVANLLAAIGAAMQLGYTPEEILEVLTEIKTPEGRFQLIETQTNQTIILDYAHTPVALMKLLKEVNKLPHRRLIVMIAGIGIRDFSKMPHMAATAEGQADEIVVTVDHPGFHNPQEIVNQVIKGFKNPQSINIHQTLSRREGVLAALSLSNEGDIVLLTSGCINGCQIVGDRYIPHSDEAIIAEYFNQQPEELKREMELPGRKEKTSK